MAELTTSRRARLTERWPTAAALMAGAATIAVVAMLDREVEYFGPVVVTMAGIYLMAFALGRLWTAWVAFAALSTVVAVMLILNGVHVLPFDPGIGMSAVVVLLWLWTVARRRFTDGRTFSVQTAGMVVFGAVTLVCIVVAQRWGMLLAGTAFLAHAGWDAYHYRRSAVVSRPYAEFCGVYDLIAGFSLIVAALA